MEDETMNALVDSFLVDDMQGKEPKIPQEKKVQVVEENLVSFLDGKNFQEVKDRRMGIFDFGVDKQKSSKFRSYQEFNAGSLLNSILKTGNHSLFYSCVLCSSRWRVESTLGRSCGSR